MDLKKFIVDVEDFPKKGISFKDITPILNNSEAFKKAIDEMIKTINTSEIDVIVAAESRGFIFASVIAYLTNKRLVLVRKPGKLPRKTISVSYTLEYGENIQQIQKGDLKENDKVLIIDDILATGGTINGIIKLIESEKAIVKEISFLIDLSFLHDDNIFSEHNGYNSVIKY